MLSSSKPKNIFKKYIFIYLLIVISSDTNILIFNSEHYAYGHSAFTKDGALIIEYSCDNKRLFYGLEKNGKFYFKENNILVPTKSIIIDGDNNVRAQSRNIFVQLNSNTNDNKEFLFSIGTSSQHSPSITELHDLENNDDKPVIRNTSDLIGSDIKSQSFSLFSINGTKTYLLAHLSEQSCYLKLLSFSNFDLNNIIINSIEIGSIIGTNSRDINCFQLNDNIILFYLYNNFFYINIYNLSLNVITSGIEIE